MTTNITALQRSTAQVILEVVPLLVKSKSGFTMCVTKCFEHRPELECITWTKAVGSSAIEWSKRLAGGAVVITVYGSPWFVVVLAE